MDSSSAGQERLEVSGRGLCPAVDLSRLLMMIIDEVFISREDWLPPVM